MGTVRAARTMQHTLKWVAFHVHPLQWMVLFWRRTSFCCVVSQRWLVSSAGSKTCCTVGRHRGCGRTWAAHSTQLTAPTHAPGENRATYMLLQAWSAWRTVGGHKHSCRCPQRNCRPRLPVSSNQETPALPLMQWHGWSGTRARTTPSLAGPSSGSPLHSPHNLDSNTPSIGASPQQLQSCRRQRHHQARCCLCLALTTPTCAQVQALHGNSLLHPWPLPCRIHRLQLDHPAPSNWLYSVLTCARDKPRPSNQTKIHFMISASSGPGAMRRPRSVALAGCRGPEQLVANCPPTCPRSQH
jgi:hypothetical protein